MLLFGHTGITLGVAVLVSRLLPGDPQTTIEEVNPSIEPSPDSAAPRKRSTRRPSWLSQLWNHFDMRIILIGSLLPDIIDKPLGQFFFRDTFNNGRIITHTLLFFILVTLLGLYLYKYRGKAGFLALSFGIFTHLVFDEMWRAPRTLLWPLLGFAFDRIEITGWLSDIFRALLTDPAVYVPELIGLAVLIWFSITLIRKRQVMRFLKSGNMETSP
ncbi:MAG: metal-dependent hydrolase [Chloroflexota bacterium]